jgi:CubicO group peptidase (beta-lactamase class C family)
MLARPDPGAEWPVPVRTEGQLTLRDVECLADDWHRATYTTRGEGCATGAGPDASGAGGAGPEPAVKPLFSARLEHAAELFRRQHESGQTPGGVLMVRRRGEIVLSEAVGRIGDPRAMSQAGAGIAMTPDTLFQVMSVSKAVVATAIAILEGRGLIDIHAPVARLWPAFAARGKGNITVLDVLTHRSGLVLEDLVQKPELWRDWEALVDAIGDAAPEFSHGTLAYEAYAFGWILAEVIRRASGRPIDELVCEELAPEIAGLRFRAAPDDVTRVARNCWLGRPGFRLGGVRLADSFEAVNNGYACFEALVPGAGMVTDAASLTAFYEMLLRGGVLASGRRLVPADVIRPYFAEGTAGRDRITGAWVVLGRGFALGWALPHPYGWWGSGRCFGHPGGFGSVALADPEADVAIAVLTTANRSIFDMVRRFAPLTDSIRRAGRACPLSLTFQRQLQRQAPS